MKKVFVILAILAMAVSVHAAPFLVCDPDPVATSYVITLGPELEIEVPAPLHYDLSNAPAGQNNIEVKAKNIWGISSAVPFEFKKQLPADPTGVGYSID